MNTVLQMCDKDVLTLVNNFLGEYNNGNECKSLLKVIRPIPIVPFSEVRYNAGTPGMQLDMRLNVEYNTCYRDSSPQYWFGGASLSIKYNGVYYNLLPSNFNPAYATWSQVFDGNTYDIGILTGAIPLGSLVTFFGDGITLPCYVRFKFNRPEFEEILMPSCNFCNKSWTDTFDDGTPSTGFKDANILYLGSIHTLNYSVEKWPIQMNANLVTNRLSKSFYNFKEGLFSYVWASDDDDSGLTFNRILGDTVLFTGWEIQLQKTEGMTPIMPPPFPWAHPVVSCRV